jgi:hypothetical protein
LLISWQQWKVLASRTRNNNYTVMQSLRHGYISILARFNVLPDAITETMTTCRLIAIEVS